MVALREVVFSATYYSTIFLEVDYIIFTSCKLDELCTKLNTFCMAGIYFLEKLSRQDYVQVVAL